MFGVKGQLLPLLLAFILFPGALGEETPCTTHHNGKFYDLNPLKASKDYEVKTATGIKISLNVCQSVKTELFGLKDDVSAGDVGGFTRRAHGDFAIGKLNTSLTIFDSRPRLVMANGSRCKAKAGDQPTEIRASSAIEFICDTSVFGPGTPRLLAQLPPGDEESGCAYVIEWRTHYACATSEGGGISGFLLTVAVIFLVLLMAYTVFGTLYNRFVLQLRGFDQIPQFSIESMKYHGREAVAWIKDIIATFDAGGGSGRGAGYSGPPSSRTPNPVSHQSQVSGFGAADGLEEGAPLSGSGFGGFIRPQAVRTTSNPFQRAEINPVSHQSHVNAQSLSFSQAPRSSQSTPQQPPTRGVGPEADDSTKDEQDFLFIDEDEDAQELGEISAPPLPSETLASSPLPHRTPAPTISPSPSSSTNPESNQTAAVRGRDLGGGDVIRL